MNDLSTNKGLFFMSKLLRFDVVFRFPLSSFLCAQSESESQRPFQPDLFFLCFIYDFDIRRSLTPKAISLELNYSYNKLKFWEIKTLKVLAGSFNHSSSKSWNEKPQKFEFWCLERGNPNNLNCFLNFKRKTFSAYCISRNLFGGGDVKM